jgi:hypothetical protein
VVGWIFMLTEISGLLADLAEPFDQRFDFGVAGPGRNMHRHDGAFLRADAVGREWNGRAG